MNNNTYNAIAMLTAAGITAGVFVTIVALAVSLTAMLHGDNAQVYEVTAAFLENCGR